MADPVRREELEYSSEVEISCEQMSQRDQRSLIFHLLYAIDAFDYDVSLESIVDNIERGFNLLISRDSFVFKTANSIVENRDKIDKFLIPFIENWKFDRLGICTKLVLRYSAWELLYTDTDAVIVINEAIELAKSFAEKDSFKFINGILDEIAKKNLSKI